MIADRVLIEQAIARGEHPERIMERHKVGARRLKEILAAMLDEQPLPETAAYQAQRLQCDHCNRAVRRDNMPRHLLDIHSLTQPYPDPLVPRGGETVRKRAYRAARQQQAAS